MKFTFAAKAPDGFQWGHEAFANHVGAKVPLTLRGRQVDEATIIDVKILEGGEYAEFTVESELSLSTLAGL